MAIDYQKLFQNNPQAFRFMEPFLGKYLVNLPINQKFKVLDIGCFQGSNLLPFIEFGCQNIYGIDMLREPLATFADKVYREYGINTHKSLNLNVGKIEDYNFKTTFDLTMCFRVMQHLSKDDSIKLIHKIQNNTVRNGLNLFIIWQDGPNFNPANGYFKLEEINNIYESSINNKWEILESKKEEHKGYSAIYFAARKK